MSHLLFLSCTAPTLVRSSHLPAALCRTSFTYSPLKPAPSRVTPFRPWHKAFGATSVTTTTTMETTSAAAEGSTSSSQDNDPLVQYVVVRRDLLDEWPTGSVIAQAVHASVAAVWKTKASESTMQYCGQKGNEDPQDGEVSEQMHTVVLEAKNESSLLKLADKLTEAEVPFVLWKEQPEMINTALATQPSKRSEIKKYFSKFRLFK